MPEDTEKLADLVSFSTFKYKNIFYKFSKLLGNF